MVGLYTALPPDSSPVLTDDWTRIHPVYPDPLYLVGQRRSGIMPDSVPMN